MLADGSSIPCLVIDASMSGVAVSSELQPEIGTPLAVGSCVGRVVRHFHDGFAVRFVDPLASMTELERRVVTQPTRPTRQRLAAHADDIVESADEFFVV